ncbi:BZ3500_MvSof-1268-A1-R1_Chr1-3g02165 [Microbotryum saponariae]|uniref:BZ3500_MvSof-1268-A1-R1_Chr1-3g02165 protein n=1 Tax=Microbotryum saponariae TaxID=289078 RepID=A0A2X0MC25_9BASI|nr:BZ3501_MvSof-1269-A2-R1_Chr10-2g02642 [Microbotryum saponariae]SCZ90702.1 BZ3500_MvSof-1268-A1-R1_Chr1-3g02165 [Microbotryum saponariae]SCZ95551.1 BZ3501_MvSof-1269-A2-R1_Chr1-3g01768 [Microbotryum saponariae]
MIINNFSQTFYLARRPGLPWAPLRSRARSEADDDPSQDEEGSAQVSDGGTYLQRVGGGGNSRWLMVHYCRLPPPTASVLRRCASRFRPSGGGAM